MDLLKKRDNESDFEYKIRLCNGKLNKEIDLDWIEIVQLLGLSCSSDHLRKLAYGYKECADYINEIKENSITDNDLLRLIEEKRVALEIEHKKIQATKIEYNRNQRTDSKRELLYENIREAQERIPLPEFKDVPINYSEGTYMLNWADIHYGADFVSENNIYNREECRRRFELLVSETKQMCIDKNIDNLVICGLGDDIQGLLRISDVKINDIPVVESVVEISRLLAQVLNSISEVTNVKYYHTMASNHSQTRPITGKADLIKEDLEIIIGNYIKDLVSDNCRIEVVLSDKDYHSIQIEGQNILLLHGHQIKNVQSAIKDYSSLHRVFYDIALIGHFHGGQSISLGEGNGNTELQIIPSIVGSDPYSDTLKKGSKSMAKMFKIEKNNGIVENYTFVLN